MQSQSDSRQVTRSTAGQAQRHRLVRRLAAASILLLCTTAIAAADEHPSVAEDASLGLGDVVEVALARYPAMLEADARWREARAWQRRGDSVVSGRPQLSFRYQTDRWGDDFGLTEYESGIQLPLWQWGQRQATRDYGGRLDTATDAMRLLLRWEVAGLVRELLWDLSVTEGRLELAEEALDTSARLLQAVERRYEIGDVAMADVLLARTRHLGVRGELISARAAVVDAARTYLSVTGLDRRPVFAPEARSEIAALGVEHPAIAFADAELASARAGEEVVRASAKSSPTVTIGPRRERTGFGQAYEDSIGVTVTVPFGGASFVDSQSAAADRATAAVQARRHQLLRDLELALHEAEHGLDVVEATRADALEQLRLAETGYRMGELAYAGGEIGLLELLTQQRVLIDARSNALQLENQWRRLVAEYNQAVGVMP